MFTTFLRAPLAMLDRLAEKPLHATLVLVAVSSALILPTLGLSGLADWDEAIYAVVARTVYRTHDIVHLTLGDQPYFNKPPLYFVLTALSFAAGGITEFAVRLPSALFGIALTVLGYHLLSRLLRPADAFLASLLPLAEKSYLMIIQHGRMESMVTFFILLALIALWRMRENSLWVLAFFAASALAVMTKGAMGFMPFFIALPVLILDRDLRSHVRFRETAAGICLFLAIALPWYILQYASYGMAFIQRFVMYETFERVSRPLEGHEGGMFFYMYQMMFRNISAWTFLIPFGVACVCIDAVRRRSRALSFLACWCMVIFVVFSFGVRTKLWWYTFALYLPAAASTAYLLSQLPRKVSFLRGLVVACAIVSLSLFNINYKTDRTSLKELRPALNSTLAPNDTLIAHDIEYQKAAFYADCNVIVTRSREEILAALAEPRRFFLMKTESFRELGSTHAIEILGTSKKHVFFRTLATQ